MKVLSVSAILTCIITFTFSLNGCNKEDHFISKNLQKEAALVMDTEALVMDTDPCELNCLLNAPDDLSEDEEAMLLKMRVNEKLAHDVYLTLSESYKLPVFTNISNSEQIHMARVLCLLIHYQMNDPASTEDGVFTDPEIQGLYNDLVAQGEISLLEALKVGASIEDLVINDLNAFLIDTENEAILSVFENLMCGSENHMRTFYRLLTARDFTYVPALISQDELDAIIESDHMSCVLD